MVEISIREMKEIVRSFSVAFAENDVEGIISFCTENVIVTDPAGTLRGAEGIRLWRKWVARRFPETTITTTNLIGERTWIVEQALTTGITPEGVTVSYPNIIIFEFKGKKIRRITELYDALAIAQKATKGWLAKKAVDSITNQFNAELR